MKQTFSALRSFVTWTILIGCFTSAAAALTVSEDFEDDPAHPNSWSALSGTPVEGWTLSVNGVAAPWDPPRARALAGDSFNGSQALSLFASTPGNVVEVGRTSLLSAVDAGFAGVAVKFPSIVNPGPGMAVSRMEPSITLLGVRFAFIGVSSGLARWFYWDDLSDDWFPIGSVVPLGTDGSASGWTRLNVRRQESMVDIWVDGKPCAMGSTSDEMSAGFQARARPSGPSLIDALVFSDHQVLFTDSDSDGMPDSWEQAFAPAANFMVDDRWGNADGDTLYNFQEYLWGSNPGLTDSDGDLIPDGWEVANGLNPADGRDAYGDFDADGVSNLEEFRAGTNPRNTSGNGPNVVYFKAGTGSGTPPNGSFENPFYHFPTALLTVPTGGKLVILGSGGPVNLQGTPVLDSSVRTLTIIGVDGATFTGVCASPLLCFTGNGTTRKITLENLIFSGCQSGTGSGIVAFSDCPAVVTRCRFVSGVAAAGGALSFNGGSLVITDSTFSGNSATGDAGAIRASNASLNLQRNRFISQIAGGKGGALALSSCSGEISNCLFSSNTSNGGAGSAIALEGSAVPVVSYCTVADNNSSTGAAVSSTAASSLPVSVNGSIFWGNKMGTTTVNLTGPATLTSSTTQTTAYSGTGNNTSNPMFLRSYHPQMALVPGDGYGLSAGSPMIDRGPNPVPGLDLDGLPRRRFLPAYITSFVSNGDRGAFEFNDTDGDNLPDGWETRYGFDPATAADRDLDADQDGYSNYEEYSAKTDPLSRTSLPAMVIYAAPTGDDAASGSFTAPVRSIAAAISKATGRIALRDGTYAGTGTGPATSNVNLNPAKAFSLSGINGPARVIIDGGNSATQAGFRFISSSTAGISLQGITLRNCSAATGNGGAIVWPSSSQTLNLYRCRFVNCSAPAGAGGAIFMGAGSMVACEFLGNSANEGGAIAGSSSNAFISIQGNTFAWNDAKLRGGALAFSSVTQAVVTRNSFYRNASLTGGAASFTNCISTWSDDGYGNYLAPTVNTPPQNTAFYTVNCVLQENVYTENSAWPVAGSTAASATASGAALALTGSTLWVEGETYQSNLSAGSAGAVLQTTGVTQFHRSRFFGNQAAGQGGVASIKALNATTGGSPSFTNCAFVTNQSGSQGGVFRSEAGSSLTLIQCTLTRNRATVGAACLADGTLLIHNSLCWYNVPALDAIGGAGSRQIHGSNCGPGTFSPATLSSGIGNSSVEPKLARDQYHLTGQPVTTLGLGRVEVVQLDPDGDGNAVLNDLEGESRPCLSTNLPEAGCDEFFDSDGDGLPDWFEQEIIARSPGDTYGTLATLNGSTVLWGQSYSAMDLLTLQADSDADGLPDGWEINNSLNPDQYDAWVDSDQDGFSNLEEYLGGSSPQNDEDAPLNLPTPKLICKEARQHISIWVQRAGSDPENYLLPYSYYSRWQYTQKNAAGWGYRWLNLSHKPPGTFYFTPDFSAMQPEFPFFDDSSLWFDYGEQVVPYHQSAYAGMWFRPVDMEAEVYLVHQQVRLRAPKRAEAWQQPYLITITGSRLFRQTSAWELDDMLVNYPVQYRTGQFTFAPNKSLSTNSVLLEPKYTLKAADFPLLSPPYGSYNNTANGGYEKIDWKLSLLPSAALIADPGKIHLGFDPPNSAENDPPGEYWASVAQSGTNGILNLKISNGDASKLEWKIADGDDATIDISPKTFSNAETKLTITGKPSTSNLVKVANVLLIPLGTNAPALLTLKIRVLPQRQKELAIYVLEDPNAPITKFTTAPVVELPSAAEILAVCNDCFKQAGVKFTLHPSSGTYQFPYDTRGFNLEEGYSAQLPVRFSDGKVSAEEQRALGEGYENRPPTSDLIFPIPHSDPNVLRIIVIKESGIPYDANIPDGPKVRGGATGIFLYARNLPLQIPIAAAHEIGHFLGLSTVAEDGNHDQPPFADAVDLDYPNSVAPVFPGNTPFPHKPSPNHALMQSGTPELSGLPWVYRRWMRNEDWLLANNIAGGINTP